MHGGMQRRSVCNILQAVKFMISFTCLCSQCISREMKFCVAGSPDFTFKNCNFVLKIP